MVPQRRGIAVGWVLLGFAGVLLALVLLPLCVPLTLRFRLDEERREWSVHYGTLRVAPGGREAVDALLNRWKRRLRPLLRMLRPVGLALWWTLRALFALLLLLFRGAAALARLTVRVIGAPFRWAAAKRAAKQADMTEGDFPASGDRGDTSSASHSGEPPEEDDTSRGGAYGSGEEGEAGEASGGAGSGPAGFSGTEHETWWSGDDGGMGTGGPGDEASGEGGAATPGEREPPFTPPPRPSEGFEGEPGGGERRRGIGERVRSAWRMAQRAPGYIRTYGPLAMRMLRLMRDLLAGYLRAIRLRRFEARLTTGGDPAALGAALGWSHALRGALGGPLGRGLLFSPDFESPELSPRGSLDVDLRVWPILFVWPTFRFVARVPWLRVIRIVRNAQQEREA